MIKLLNRQRPYRFCLPQAQSPTYFNIGKQLQAMHWRSTRFAWRADLGERHFQFDPVAAESLELKDKLAQLVTQYCPKVMPVTYCINDHNWPVVLSQLAADDSIWILKPAHLNNGKHIKIFAHLDQLEAHYLSSKRLGGPHVLQHYIDQPHLLKGHKYSIRMFVILTNYAGAYLYPQGYFNVAQQPYQAEQFENLNPHLTNEHLHHDESNVIQIPSKLFEFFPQLYIQIKAIVAATVLSLQKMHPQAFECTKDRTLAVFGFDFMVDTNMQAWLLEANHGPCFPINDAHPLQKHLYTEFWQALIENFILPIAKRQSLEQICYPLFESVEYTHHTSKCDNRRPSCGESDMI